MSSPSSGNVRTGRRGTTRALLAGGFTTAVVAGSLIATAGPGNAASGWDSVAQCESGGNPSTNTGNGYYGLYQFDQQTWQGLGYSGTADQYSAAVQTQAAEKLYAQRGSSPWPVCGKYLSGSASVSSSSGSSSGSTASRSYTRHAVTSSSSSSDGEGSTVRHYSSGVLGPWLIAQKRSDVRAIQQKLTDKGYTLAIDGQYGPETAGVVKQFQTKAGIGIDGLYGPQTKAALFG